MRASRYPIGLLLAGLATGSGGSIAGCSTADASSDAPRSPAHVVPAASRTPEPEPTSPAVAVPGPDDRGTKPPVPPAPPPPEPNPPEVEPLPVYLAIILEADGRRARLVIEGEDVGPIAPDGMDAAASRLKASRGQGRHAAEIAMAFDGKVPHRAVIDVLNLAIRAGFKAVTFSPEPPTAEGRRPPTRRTKPKWSPPPSTLPPIEIEFPRDGRVMVNGEPLEGDALQRRLVEEADRERDPTDRRRSFRSVILRDSHLAADSVVDRLQCRLAEAGLFVCEFAAARERSR